MVVLAGGRPVEVTSRKQRALLALLALRAGQVLSVDRLVDDLWGERPPATARHALQVHVSNLRKVLGPETVVTERPGYVLRIPADACDANLFEALARVGRQALRAGDAEGAASTLAEALASWRGPALADLLFEPYASQEAGRLEELRLGAFEDRIVADLELGRHADLVSELESLVGSHPLRERLWALLMVATYRSGRQADALQAYRTVRERLRDELGLDPGPELQQLEAAILRHDPALASPAPPAAERAITARPAPVETTVPAAREAPAETRRVATVVVADLVGFDEVASGLDPEDLRTLLDRCMARLSSVVAKYGGVVDNIVGGELIAVFGAPSAHEDDPERALRAAMDLQQAVAENRDEFGELELRVGVNSGAVLLAASGPPGRRQFAVMGEVVNVARRLATQAEATAVVIGESTALATRGVATVRSSGPASFQVVELAPRQHGRASGAAPLIGRDAELELLQGVWARVRAERRPHFVSILGEPGVGKSRQLAEFQRLAEGTGSVFTGWCLPYGEALSYAPLAGMFRAAAGSALGDPADTVRSKLRDLVHTLEPLQDDEGEVARHLALLTGLDDESDRAGGLVDERTIHGSTRRFVEALAHVRPLCLVLEDAHWADDALLDLVHTLARRVRGAPLMILVLARPELVERRPDWGGGIPTYISLSLNPLDAPSTFRLVSELGKAHALPETMLAEIATKSGGNPLFAEELVATVAEGDASAGVPASLMSLLLARVDALPSDQQLALRRASVLGMTFWPGAVHALAAVDDDGAPAMEMEDALADLEERDLLRVDAHSALPGHTAYVFKHALIREAAYESLPRSKRAELHRRATEWLSAAAGDRISDFADQLANHATAAGEPERALEYLMTAAERSLRAASHRREAALLADALEIASSLGRADLVPELRARRGKALSRLALWAEARTEFEACLEEMPAETPEQLCRRAEVECDLSAACFWLLDTAAIAHHARAALDIAELVNAPDIQLAARAQITSAHSAMGDVDVVLAEGAALIEDAAAWGIRPPYERLGGYSLQLYLTGNWQATIDVARHAVESGRERGDTQGVLWNMPHVGMALAATGNYSAAIAMFDEARRFGEEYELHASLPRCIAMSAGFHLDLFDHEGAEEIQEQARDLGRMYFNPSAVSAGIDLLFNYTRRGDIGRAEVLVDDLAVEVMSGGGWHGWLWRLRFTQLQAEMAAARGDHAAAMELAHGAIEQSRSKRRLKYEAFSRLTLGDALAAAGRKAEALIELAAATSTMEALGNPALYVMAAAAQLDLEPVEEVAIKGRAAVERVLANLSDAPMRRRFLSSRAVESVR